MVFLNHYDFADAFAEFFLKGGEKVFDFLRHDNGYACCRQYHEHRYESFHQNE